MKLKELEKRLSQEPDNLGLRVQVAGLMREAGRTVEAVELYRTVALAYRDQGRTQQAIAVCRSILEIAPDDSSCQGLLDALQASSRPSRSDSEPMRRPSFDETPLPRPVPYHVADPTSQRYRVSERELQLPLPPGEQTPPPGVGPGFPSRVDAAAEVETRQRPKVRTDEIEKLEDVTTPLPMGRPTPITDVQPRLTPTAVDHETDDLLTEPRERLSRASDDEMTRPLARQGLFEDDDDDK